MSVWLHPLPVGGWVPSKELFPEEVWADLHGLHLENTLICKSRVPQTRDAHRAAVPHAQSRFVRSCQGWVNLKSWLICVLNSSLPAEPLRAFTGSSAHSSMLLACQHPAQASPCLAKSETEGQKAALHCVGLCWGCGSWVRFLQPSEKY